MRGYAKINGGEIKGSFGSWGWGWAVYDNTESLVLVLPTKTKFLARVQVPTSVKKEAEEYLRERQT